MSRNRKGKGSKRNKQRRRNYAQEARLKGATKQERFRDDVRLDQEVFAQTRPDPPAIPKKVQAWIDSSPGTNVQVSPDLSQAEADEVARTLKIPLQKGHIPHIGYNMYSINCPITPDMAFLWLDQYNIMNRVPGKSNWKMLAADINTGRWIPTHQAFAFIVSREGEELTPILCDGQHRARGIHSAGFPVMAVVTLNVLPDSVRVMDTHMIRTVRALIELDGKSMRTFIEGAIKIAILGPHPKRPKPSMNEKFWFAQRFMDVLEWIDKGCRPRVQNVMIASVLAAIMRADIMWEHQKRARLNRFLQILREGQSMDIQDRAAVIFRDWLQTRRPKKMQAFQIYLRTCGQIQLFMRGEHSPRVMQVKEDPFPLPEKIVAELTGQQTEAARVADFAEKPATPGKSDKCSQ